MAVEPFECMNRLRDWIGAIAERVFFASHLSVCKTHPTLGRTHTSTFKGGILTIGARKLHLGFVMKSATITNYITKSEEYIKNVLSFTNRILQKVLERCLHGVHNKTVMPFT